MKLSRYTYLMMTGHICADITQGALPAILPFLIAEGNITYTSAAGLVLATSSVSSLLQPAFGYLGDRGSNQWLMALGIFLAGTGFAIIGFMDSYWGMFAAAAVSGAGVALFHPEGGKTANLVAGENKGMGMGLFGAGGNIGFTLGPMIASVTMVSFGIKGTAFFFFPAIVVTVIFLMSIKTLKKFMHMTASENDKKGYSEDNENNWSSFGRAVSIVFIRSIINYGLLVFVPLYWVGILGQSEASGSIKLTIMSGVGVFATLTGGKLADKLGFVPVIRAGNILMIPFLILLLMTENILTATLLLIPIAFCNSVPYSAMIALSQSFLPKSVGLASGITLGLSVSIGGMVSPFMGKIADIYGLTAAMYVLLGFAVVAVFISFILPKEKSS